MSAGCDRFLVGFVGRDVLDNVGWWEPKPHIIPEKILRDCCLAGTVKRRVVRPGEDGMLCRARWYLSKSTRATKPSFRSTKPKLMDLDSTSLVVEIDLMIKFRRNFIAVTNIALRPTRSAATCLCWSSLRDPKSHVRNLMARSRPFKMTREIWGKPLKRQLFDVVIDRSTSYGRNLENLGHRNFLSRQRGTQGQTQFHWLNLKIRYMCYHAICACGRTIAETVLQVKSFLAILRFSLSISSLASPMESMYRVSSSLYCCLNTSLSESRRFISPIYI